jgi:peptide/nickel transport system permease protein
MLKKHPTLKYILERGWWYLLTFFVAISINFFLPRLGKADPVKIILSKTSGGLSHDQMRQKEDGLLKRYGLAQLNAQGQVIRDAKDQPLRKPLMVQYINYMKMTLRGDLGISMKQDRPVMDILMESMPWTVILQFPTIVLGWIFGNLLGAYAAYKRGIFDKVLFPASLLSCSIPFFVFGMLLVYAFAILINGFPAYGGYAWAQTPGFNWGFISSAAYHYVLPFMSIFPVLVGGQAIGMRSMGIYELGTDYIKFAKTIGVKESKIIMYIFRNAMLPQIAGLAISLGSMVGGALITEMIFSYPGLGMALLNAVQSNDYFVIQGGALIVAVTLLIANFSVDVLIGILDPRVKAGRMGA